MRIIDRYLLRQFVQTFLICFLSLVGIVIVFDLFTNLDEFVEAGKANGGACGSSAAITYSRRSGSSIASAGCWP